jgi:hypothetical protein
MKWLRDFLLIEKGGLQKIATGTPPTFATEENQSCRTVAPVATVAVANPEKRNSEADVLQALITLGTWRTTNQIAEAVNLPAVDVLPVLEALLEVGYVERDGGPIYIWLHSGARLLLNRYLGSQTVTPSQPTPVLHCDGFKSVTLKPDVTVSKAQLEPGERKLLHAFKRRFGGSTEWRPEAGAL